ncbi:hypothetical protein GCM10018966_054910 [Streptomyces yanii]
MGDELGRLRGTLGRHRRDELRGIRVAAHARTRARSGSRYGLRGQRLSVRLRLGLGLSVRLGLRIRLRLSVRLRLFGRQGPALLPVRLPLVVLRVLALRRRVLLRRLRRLRPPGLTPWLPARRGGPVGRSARYPGLAATCGQHDTFVRGPYSRELLLVTLSALRHRDSYV